MIPALDSAANQGLVTIFKIRLVRNIAPSKYEPKSMIGNNQIRFCSMGKKAFNKRKIVAIKG